MIIIANLGTIPKLRYHTRVSSPKVPTLRCQPREGGGVLGIYISGGVLTKKGGGLRCGHSPKRGVLGAGTAPKKGGLRCGHNQKRV